ncbi:MAG: hypothetical protein HQL57_02540 [Magnetococcales bacterium]|nr:hypothetical protein [Magnetococcales bacterium]MBF0156045.1 hypothetical protein [Magnetococcales bacterium]
MPVRRIASSAFLAAALASTSPSAAVAGSGVWYPGEFSANITMTQTKTQEKATGRLFVGKGRIRAEGTFRNEPRAVIIDTEARKVFTLITDKKQFHKGLGEVPQPPKPDIDILPQDKDGPCNQKEGPTCRKVSEEPVNGVPCEKWEILFSRQGEKRTVTVWADPARHIVLKQEAPETPTMERKLTSTEEVGGRPTEKWTVSHQFKGETRSFTQWVDTALRLPVFMDGGSSGFSMTVSDIKEAAQAESLFALPEGYQEIPPPAQEMPPPAAGSSQPGADRP